MVHARFIFFKYSSIEKKDESIDLMKKVFEIDGSLLNTNLKANLRQPHLLCAYGDLLRHYISENLKKKYDTDNRKKFDNGSRVEWHRKNYSCELFKWNRDDLLKER